MRKLMLIIGLAALGIMALHRAEAAVKLTQTQVQTVCNGKNSCVKDCGLNGEHICIFACGTKTCSGACSTCGVKTRSVFPNLYSNRVVRAQLALPVRTSYRAGRPTYCEWCYASCPQGWGGSLCRLHCQTRGGCKPPIVRHP